MKLSTVLCSVFATLAVAAPTAVEEAKEYSFEEYSALVPRSSSCSASLRPSGGAQCGVLGSLIAPVLGTTIRAISFDACSTACTCDSSTCKSFSWNPNPLNRAVGACRIYKRHLNEQKFQTGIANLAGKLLNHWDRNCYHKGAPTPTAAQTHSVSKPTPPAYKRDATLDVEIARAMAI